MTLQLHLESDLQARIDQIAAERGNTIEEVILDMLRRETALKPRPAWMGMARSGIPDFGARAEEFLFENLETNDDTD